MYVWCIMYQQNLPRHLLYFRSATSYGMTGSEFRRHQVRHCICSVSFYVTMWTPLNKMLSLASICIFRTNTEVGLIFRISIGVTINFVKQFDILSCAVISLKIYCLIAKDWCVRIGGLFFLRWTFLNYFKYILNTKIISCGRLYNRRL